MLKNKNNEQTRMETLCFPGCEQNWEAFSFSLDSGLLLPQNLKSSSLKLRAHFCASLRGGFARHCDDNGSNVQN